MKYNYWSCDMTLNGRNDFIRAVVAIDGLRECSCSHDKTIKLWKVRSGVCERTLEGHMDIVMDMALLLDGSAKIWNVETGVCDLSINTVGSSYTSILRVILQLYDGRLLVSSYAYQVYHLG
jgi:WD40 repeat protein